MTQEQTLIDIRELALRHAQANSHKA